MLNAAAPQCKKGDSISTFLEKCRQQFPELRGISVDNLMYVKVRMSLSLIAHWLLTVSQIGGSHHSSRMLSLSSLFRHSLIYYLMIQHHTFYDFIINKARGKSGPLFNFDVHDDVRLLADATVEKDESHAGKVVERSWYQRNKHIFPASRWEVRVMSSISFFVVVLTTFL